MGMKLSRKVREDALALAAPPPARSSDPGRWVMTVLGWHPTTLNSLIGCHKMTTHKRKKVDQVLVGAEALRHAVPRASRKRRVGLQIVLGPRGRGADPDAYWKSLLDALVACGLLVDDSSRWVELGPVEFGRGKRSAVITLEDLTS